MKPITAILAVAACIALITFGAGCISFGQSDLNGTAWKLESFGTDKTVPVSVITISFTDGNAAGSSGVNAFAAKYELDTNGGKLSFSSVSTTKMAGPANLMNEENTFIAALKNTAQYTVSGETLTLKDSNGKTLAVFGNPLKGTSWKLISYTPAGSIEEKNAAGLVTIMFGENGKVTGSTGINTYSADWKLDGTALTISQPTVTKVLGSEFMKTQETTFVSLLGGVSGFTLSANQLDLLNEAGVPVLSFVQLLPETSWGMIQLNGEDIVTDTQTTITFNEDGTFSGNAPVNTYNGQWKTTGIDKISLTNIASTMLISTDSFAVSTEQQVFEILNTATTYTVTDDGLTISGKTGSLGFAPNYQQLLAGTSWKLADNADVTISFSDNAAKIFGQGPVNTYSADVAFESYDYVVVSNFISTKMGGSVAEMNEETAFFTLLESLENVAFSEGQLVLSNGQTSVYAVPM